MGVDTCRTFQNTQKLATENPHRHNPGGSRNLEQLSTARLAGHHWIPEGFLELEKRDWQQDAPRRETEGRRNAFGLSVYR